MPHFEIYVNSWTRLSDYFHIVFFWIQKIRWYPLSNSIKLAKSNQIEEITSQASPQNSNILWIWETMSLFLCLNRPISRNFACSILNTIRNINNCISSGCIKLTMDKKVFRLIFYTSLDFILYVFFYYKQLISVYMAWIRLTLSSFSQAQSFVAPGLLMLTINAFKTITLGCILKFTIFYKSFYWCCSNNSLSQNMFCHTAIAAAAAATTNTTPTTTADDHYH